MDRDYREAAKFGIRHNDFLRIVGDERGLAVAKPLVRINAPLLGSCVRERNSDSIAQRRQEPLGSRGD